MSEHYQLSYMVDTVKWNGKTDEHRPSGFGTIPWPSVIARLRDLGYEGYANFESGPWGGGDAAEGYRHAIAFWRECERIAMG